MPICWNQARPVGLPLPIILCVNATARRFGGFGVRRNTHVSRSIRVATVVAKATDPAVKPIIHLINRVSA